MKALALPAAFFAACRDPLLFNGPLKQAQVDGINTLLAAMGAAGWSAAWTAYGLATAFHETARTMQPIKELGGDAYFCRMYDPAGQRPWVARALGNTLPGDGARFPGMGYCQCTGRANAERATAVCQAAGIDVDLVAHPALLMRPDIAALVLISGLSRGWFSGHSLGDYLILDHGDADSFIAARRVVNRQDKAALIASFAIKFQSGLQLGGWA